MILCTIGAKQRGVTYCRNSAALLSRRRSTTFGLSHRCPFCPPGGYDGNEFLASVEVYDPDQDEWKEVSNMLCGRSGHGVGVAAQPCFN